MALGEVLRTEIAEGTDDPVAPEVGRVRQGRTPVAVGSNQGLLVQEGRITPDKPRDGVQVVVPDRVDQLHGLHEARPARRLIAAREHELRVSQARARRLHPVRVPLAKIGRGRGIAFAKRPQEIFRLMFELIEIRTNGKTTDRHGEPPRSCPGSAGVGRRRFGREPDSDRRAAGGLGPVRGREAACDALRIRIGRSSRPAQRLLA